MAIEGIDMRPGTKLGRSSKSLAVSSTRAHGQKGLLQFTDHLADDFSNSLPRRLLPTHDTIPPTPLPATCSALSSLPRISPSSSSRYFLDSVTGRPATSTTAFLSPRGPARGQVAHATLVSGQDRSRRPSSPAVSSRGLIWPSSPIRPSGPVQIPATQFGPIQPSPAQSNSPNISFIYRTAPMN
ncbi:hypothetical protein CRG98_021644 [Punica granatum]|uniref:Uncharacterized protein n=1 Tax=Punica granatum TaxID=22663 RepID=A0A2I0JNX1_PUNGR|nr:hypothetical protein CRG98_021644 [Punica granatum]